MRSVTRRCPWMAAVFLVTVHAPVWAGDREELQRSERLDRQRAVLAAAIDDPLTASWSERWSSALAERLGDQPARWLKASDGYLAARDLQFELAWNRPADGREAALCVDATQPGHPLEMISSLAKELREHGIEFLVVPVPTRANVYPELVLGRDVVGGETRGMAPGLERFLAALTERGVEVVDLLPAMAAYKESDAGKAYSTHLRYNVHWSPPGARLAARVVYERLLELPVFEQGPLEKGRDFRFKKSEEPWQPFEARRPSETVPERLLFVRLLDARSMPFEIADKAASILLIGDSFVKYFGDQQASFADNLVGFTGQTLDIVAQQGGRSVHRALSLREAHGVPTKKIVIWLFAATSLSNPAYWKPVSYFD